MLHAVLGISSVVVIKNFFGKRKTGLMQETGEGDVFRVPPGWAAELEGLPGFDR